MRVLEIFDNSGSIGIMLTAENSSENKTLERFWEGGAKVNAFLPRNTCHSLELTFADLIQKGEKTTMQDTYDVVVECDNCGFEGPVKVNKGERVRDERCPKCLVREDMRRHEDYYKQKGGHFQKCSDPTCWCHALGRV